MTICETPRLVLRRLTDNDYPALCKILQDEQVMYAWEHAFSDEEVRQWLQNQQARYREYGVGLWAAVLRRSGEVIGQCGITYQDYRGTRVPEVGYLFQKAYWHCGYAAEAAAACKEYAFSEMQVPGLYAMIRPENLPSQRVAQRLGMQKIDCIVKHYNGKDMPHNVFFVSR